MKIIFRLKRHHYLARVNIFLITVVLIVGVIGCGGGVEYDLTITSTAGGSVANPGEDTYTYDAGEVVNLVAEPDEGYRFENWTGDVGTIADVNDATTTITLNRDCTITAIFMKKRPVDLLMITTSLLEKEPNFEDTVNQYKSVLVETEDLSADYIELDSDECLSTYGVKVNNLGDWEEVRDVLQEIIGIAEASYIMILGGPLVVPRPVVDACCNDVGNPISVPSDAWYVDFDNDQIVDEGLSISRLPDLSHNSSAVVEALQTAIELHNEGGFTLDNEVRFTLNDYTTPPYGVCDACDEMDAFFVLMSTNDYIVFAGHGSPTAIYSNDYVLKFSIDYIESIDLQDYHPVIIAYFPCSAGGLYPNGSTLSYEFIKAGAAAYLARTTTQGVPNYVVSNFPSDIAGGMRIGPALFQSMRQTVLVFGDTFKAAAGHICIYGDPTLMRKPLPHFP